MGKKGYNWKSRAVANVEVDNSTTKEVNLFLITFVLLPREKDKLFK